MRGGGHELVAGEDLVDLALQRRRISRIATLRIAAEADLELRAVVEQELGVEVAERMARPDRVLEHVAAAGAEEDLDPTRGLPGGDPLLLAFRQPGLELDRAEHVERDRDDDGGCIVQLSGSRLHLHAVSADTDGGHRRVELRLDRRGRGDRLEQRAGVLDERHPAARVLGEREAVPREGMPAQDRDRAGVLERCVRQRLELRLEHGTLLLAQLELVEPVGDRQPVEPRQHVQCVKRIVRVRERVADAVDEAVPAPLGDGVPLGDRPLAPLAAHPPVRPLRVGAQLHAETGAGDLRPGVRLVPVHPRAAVLNRDPVPLGAPGPTAEPVTRLEQQHRTASEGELARRSHAGKAPADDDHVACHARTIRASGAIGAEIPRSA